MKTAELFEGLFKDAASEETKCLLSALQQLCELVEDNNDELQQLKGELRRINNSVGSVETAINNQE